jgi:hypothetical protein
MAIFNSYVSLPEGSYYQTGSQQLESKNQGNLESRLSTVNGLVCWGNLLNIWLSLVYLVIWYLDDQATYLIFGICTI